MRETAADPEEHPELDDGTDSSEHEPSSNANAGTEALAVDPQELFEPLLPARQSAAGRDRNPSGPMRSAL